MIIAVVFLFMFLLATPNRCLGSDAYELVTPQRFDDSTTNLSDEAVQKSLPEAYAEFKRALDGECGTNDVLASMGLVAKAQEALLKVPEVSPASPELKDAMDAYRGAWRLALRVHLGSKDPASSNLFLSSWDLHLHDPGMLVASQLYALARVWDHNLLTATLWNNVRNTDNHRMITAITWLIYARGDKDELTELNSALGANPRLTPDLEDLRVRVKAIKSDTGDIPHTSSSLPQFDFY